MLTFMSVALLIYGSMHLYALSKVWLVLPHTAWLAAALVLAGFVLTLSPLILWQIARLNLHTATLLTSWASYLWMGFLFLFCCTALLFDLAQLLAALLACKWPLNATNGLLSISLLSLGLLGYGYFSARQIQVEEVKIITPKLGSGKVTIAQISDLHLGVMLGDGFLQRIIAKLQGLQPDIVVATGDIVDGQGDDFNLLANRFRTLQAPGGLYAITGNHEYIVDLDHSLNFLRKAGFTVLRGEAASAGSITLAGVDDPTSQATGQEARLDARAALAAAVAKNNYIVLLKHQPDVDTGTPFDLQLSGHIHGGQIFPFGLLPWLAYGVHSGLTRLDNDRLLYVSRGTGTWGPPVRLFAPPEITLITIQSANP
ncbi:MAG: hypothetical protein B7Y56_03890 [Gallionellales bacterium 35-53-114]|jgi:predicted MPP superfamily phosphohydrolase|nr:MAG: hypothetical protein B7Y56_03890 [Gallionellales bacterium 35-53-114]OYZ65241.1 MAG: hypothetical protein B7Y04_01050 [Gallionellales bacterium 24-53-125]OZB08147.1 MAG: hypothetical protein B7X61_11500 [Gallionellales bacterium 39-52-133]HQS58071.1 metallophosphoesterase [Gallionellaceae bacterium]HQS73626.1 metallophosphoesterase [Gallionellaceae bacterium]